MNAHLSPPDIRFKESYIAGLREYHAEERFLDDDEKQIAAAFESFVEREKGKARGENLKPGYIPETRFWLVMGDEYIGELGIRHYLTEHLLKMGGHVGYVIRPSKRKQGYGKLILKLGLEKAKEMGFEKVLLTCDITNDGSRKIIEGNGGVLENVEPNTGQPDKARFWIDIQKPTS